ncbi:MAG: hypothetical protein KKA12_03315 [Alphaproteobacteria bacterium]|nr:hypothetical protein [Alphaproteobacteria bacterium]
MANATTGGAGLALVSDLHECVLGGRSYRFRTPDVYDPSRARRLLTRQRVRRPALLEFRLVGVAGVLALAEAVGDRAEGARQRAVIEEWYDLLEPLDEDKLDEPDYVERGAELARLEADRLARQAELQPQAMMIEANLERHWQPYAELLADRRFWDDISAIEIVRLLLVSIDGAALRRDDDGLVMQEAYKAIPPDHRTDLATFAFRLLAPDETQRKN